MTPEEFPCDSTPRQPRSPIVVAGELVRRENDPLCNEAAKVIAELEAEVQHYKAFVGGEDVMSDFQTASDMRAEIERLRADAERLDWLMHNITDKLSDHLTRQVYRHGGFSRAAIDAARAAGGEQANEQS